MTSQIPRILIPIILSFSISFIAGCGTYLNVTAKDDPSRSSFVFGGVARDLTMIGIGSIVFLIESGEEEDDSESSFDEDHTSEDENNNFDTVFLLALIDLPITFVGDIVTIPIILDKKDPQPRYQD